MHETGLNLNSYHSRMSRLSLLFSSLALFLLPEGAMAAFLKNVPLEVRQPNGEVIQVLVTGDEFYRSVHDRDGYTIIQHPRTGYYVYVESVKNDELQSSNLIVGKDSPRQAAIKPGLNISPEAVAKRRQRSLLTDSSPPVFRAFMPKRGIVNNLAVMIRFSDQPEFGRPRSFFDGTFNTDSGSTKNYFLEASYGQLSVYTHIFPQPDGEKILSYQDPHPRSYYEPYSAINPNGFRDTERMGRELALLKNAINAIALQVPTDLPLDADGDDSVDHVSFIIRGEVGLWGELLWPHGNNLSSQQAFINGKRVSSCDLIMMSMFSVGVISHEMSHSIGFPDLYYYDIASEAIPVGPWDVLAAPNFLPQHMGAYMKYRYARWIKSLPIITADGTYTLNPLTSATNNCYKIASPNSSSEFFVVEYRRLTGLFESGLPEQGLLVYRINLARDGMGNALGPPDEIHVYRVVSSSTSEGNIYAAPLSLDSGRTAINDYTNPSSLLQNGGRGGLLISKVGRCGDTISFEVRFGPQSGLQVARTGSGLGSVNSTPAGIDCGLNCSFGFLQDTQVTLTANPAPEVVFAGWQGECTGQAQQCTVTMDATKSVSAEFKSLDSAPFTEIIDHNFPPLQYGSAAWGDYDLDGQLDLLLTGDSALYYNSRLFHNQTGQWEEEPTSMEGIDVGVAVWGDFDNDGDLDVALNGLGFTGPISKIYRNDNGAFVDIGADLLGLAYGKIAWGDFDNDGDLDLAITGEDSWGTGQSFTKIYRNDNGVFRDANVPLPGVKYSSVAWGDYDNDGDLDLLLSGMTDDLQVISRIYRNDHGVFTDTDANLQGICYGSTSWADYDNDGNLDVLITGDSSTDLSNPVSRLYRNCNGVFVEVGRDFATAVNGTAAWGDYDNDGDLDLFITGLDKDGIHSRILRNDNGTFVDVSANLAQVYAGSGAWGDFDNDGDLDAILFGSLNDWMGLNALTRIYHNDTSTKNVAPSSPTNLRATVNLTAAGSEVIFHWDPSGDDKTPPAGLTYNLRVGTTPGGREIVSPMALPDGKRLIAEKGRWQGTMAILNQLPPGNYYWTVQAIDTGFSGSPFAIESTFTIPENSARDSWQRSNGNIELRRDRGN